MAIQLQAVIFYTGTDSTNSIATRLQAIASYSGIEQAYFTAIKPHASYLRDEIDEANSIATYLRETQSRAP